MDNGQSTTDARLDALERWRDKVDDERGAIAADFGRFDGLMESLKEFISSRFDKIDNRLSDLEGNIGERPSRSEFDRDLTSIRAKVGKGKITELLINLPGKINMKLVGVSGITIVIVVMLFIIALVSVTAVWLTLRK
jgi:hypothetical protein